ncbi:uncharacterized protein LAJ45_00987 [Morchella importuna]|uniref:uncharacterized protein n=1 Tax=Morchella importuna TaxID=1174673 RepID=UPI001E8D9952|nr:uncharacterized protein LAJ45_00987 [Morchella importuna]KAH8154460.1 hypothetical protein LAJ45_00987 [Morchella importuna]
MSYSPIARVLFRKLVQERYLFEDDEDDTVSNAAEALTTMATDTTADAQAEEEEEAAFELIMQRVQEAEARLERLRRNMAKVFKTTKNLNKRVRVDRKRQKRDSKRRKITHARDTDRPGDVSQLGATSQTRENDEESRKIASKIRTLVKELDKLSKETSSITRDNGPRVIKE